MVRQPCTSIEPNFCLLATSPTVISLKTAVEGDPMSDQEKRERVPLTNLDQPRFQGRERDEASPGGLSGRHCRSHVPELAERPLSVVRVVRGQAPFMQKNVPRYTPLDQCWDLLRQRRALIDAGRDPGGASVRGVDTVEHYKQ